MEYKGIKHEQAKVNLFFNYYQSKDRQHEIDECLNRNKSVFDRVIIIEGRPTFSELFALTKDYPNDINCFCNSDIYFEDVGLLHSIKPDECYALTRDDLRNTVHARGAQDAWIFRGEVRSIKANFTMGMWGCDNHLAWLIQNAKYKVKNPCLSIKIVHLHKEDNRVHKRTKENTVDPPYLLIPPVSL